MEAYLPALLSLLGALVGASISGWFAYRRLLSEKWWDRKFQAYYETLEALNSIRDDFETSIDAHIIHKDIGDERQSELRRAYETGRRSVEKQRAIGGLVLGRVTIEALKKFEHSLTQASNAVDYFSHLDESLAATNEAIAVVVEQGQRELKANKK